MIWRRPFALLVIGLLAVATVVAVGSSSKDKVLLSDVESITLHAGRMTNARRGYPIPQVRDT